MNERLSRELVRALRAKRSQTTVSRRLGYSSNVIYAWESGQRAPTLGDFLRFLTFYGKDLNAAFSFLGVSPREKSARDWDDREVAAIVSHLVGTRATSQLAAVISVHRGTLTRWVEGESQPRLPQFLRLLEATTHRLLEFVSLIVDPEKLDSVREAYRTLGLQQTLAYDHPASGLVLRALELETYRQLPTHSSGELIRATGLREEEVDRLLVLLQEAGLVRWCSPRYELVEVSTVDTSRDVGKSRAIKQFWSEVVHERIVRETWPASALNSFNLASVSQSTLDKIREKHIQYFEEVRALVAADENPTEVLLLNWYFWPTRNDGCVTKITPYKPTRLH